MENDYKSKRNNFLKKAAVSAITFTLIFAFIIPTINSQFIKIANEKLANFIERVDFECEYTLTINIIGNGTVTKVPNKTSYLPGTVVQLTATPNSGWTFTEWSGDLTGSSNPVNITMNSDKIINATFNLCQYTLTINIVGNGTVSKDPNQTTYPHGTVVTLTANANPGWTFSAWSGDLTGSTNPTTITMTSNKTVTATFTQNEYTLTINIIGNGSVSKNPNQSTYHYGDVVTLTANADNGWSFSIWSGDLTGSTNPTTITINGNKTVTATFTQNEYTLTINIIGSGTVTKDPNQSTYHYGDIVQLTANANPGWTFNHWSGDLTGTTNPTTITINGNKTVTANFTQNEYTLTINIEGSGTVTKDPNQTSYPYGTVVTLTAIPDSGWTFDHWSGDLTGSTNPTTITMNGNKTVIANFTINYYTLTINIEGNGTVTKDPNQTTYPYGTIVTLTAIPDEDWSFSHWSGDLSGTNNPEDIIIDDNKIVTAHFSLDEYTITINIDGEGSVIKDPDYATYPYGTIVELTAIPDSGWTFDHWSGDINGTENPKEILIDGNKIVNAHFIVDPNAPVVEIIKPTKGIYFKDMKILPFIYPVVLNEITIQANASDEDTGIERVEFYINGELKETDVTEPYQCLWNENLSNIFSIKKHNIEVKAYDLTGNSASKEVDIIRVVSKNAGILVLALLLIIVLIYMFND
jgi:uncharacterized repeat protein (TIGR02543 family)